MFFFCKPKTIVLDCFINNIHIYNRFKVDRAVKFLPEWWKQLKGAVPYHNQNKVTIPMPTIKKCPGIIDLYDRSFVLPLWSDLVLENNSFVGQGNYRYQFADGCSVISMHPKEQYSTGFENYIHGKIISPWRIKDKKNTNFHVSPCNWSLLNITNNLCVLDGILRFKYQSATHINFMYHINAEPQILLEAGTPMLHLMPMTEKNIELRHHLLDDTEYSDMFKDEKISYKFVGDYKDKEKNNSLPK